MSIKCKSNFLIHLKFKNLILTKILLCLCKQYINAIFLQILGAVLLLVCAQALPLEEQYHQATSFSSFNEHHNRVHHVHSAPAVVKASVALPVHPSSVHVAPLHIAPQPSHSSISISHGAPIAKFAPVAIHSAPTEVIHHKEEEYVSASLLLSHFVKNIAITEVKIAFLIVFRTGLNICSAKNCSFVLIDIFQISQNLTVVLVIYHFSSNKKKL